MIKASDSYLGLMAAISLRNSAIIAAEDSGNTGVSKGGKDKPAEDSDGKPVFRDLLMGSLSDVSRAERVKSSVSDLKRYNGNDNSKPINTVNTKNTPVSENDTDKSSIRDRWDKSFEANANDPPDKNRSYKPHETRRSQTVSKPGSNRQSQATVGEESAAVDKSSEKVPDNTTADKSVQNIEAGYGVGNIVAEAVGKNLSADSDPGEFLPMADIPPVGTNITGELPDIYSQSVVPQTVDVPENMQTPDQKVTEYVFADETKRPSLRLDDLEKLVEDLTGESLDFRVKDLGADITSIHEFMGNMYPGLSEKLRELYRSGETTAKPDRIVEDSVEPNVLTTGFADIRNEDRISADTPVTVILNAEELAEGGWNQISINSGGAMTEDQGFGSEALLNNWEVSSEANVGADWQQGNPAVFSEFLSAEKLGAELKTTENQRLYQTVQVNRSELMNELEKGARIILSGERSEMTMQLKPESLGKVSLKIITEHGLVNAKFTVESEQAKKELETNIQVLKETLEKQGMSVRECTVQVKQDKNSSGQTDSHNQSKRQAHNETGGENGSVLRPMMDAEKRELLRSQYFYDESSVLYSA